MPTSADAVFFTASSGAGTVTIATGNTGALSINCTGFTGTLAGSAAITVSGSVTLVAGMTVTYTGTLTLNGTGTLTSAGKTLGAVTINGSGITVTLGDALNVGTRAITITVGTFSTNNYNITADTFSSNNSNIRTINLGSSTLTLNGITPIEFNANTNLTFNAGTSTINCTFSGAEFRGGSTTLAGVTFYNVSFTSTATGTHSIFSNNTFNNLSITGPASAGIRQVTFDSRQTINGTLSTTGTAGNRRIWFRSSTYGIAHTLTINSAPSLTDADFRDIYVIGTAAPISGTRIGDLRGCSGITFSTPKTVYWNLAGAQNWSANGWAPTSGGTPNTDNFPLAQDTAVFDNTGSVTGTITMNTAITYTGTVDMSGRTSAMTLSLSAGVPIVYGNWINGSGVSILGASSNITFSGRNTQTITSAGKTFPGALTVDTYGGSVELADALNIGSNTLTVTNGTFDTKNFNVTAGSLSSSNSNVRTVTLGSSTVALSSTTAIQVGTSTNLTLSSGTSQINLSSTSAITFSSGGLTFYNVSFTGTTAVTHAVTGANTFNNFTLTAPAVAGLMVCTFDSNQTITGTLTVAGASPVRRIFLRSSLLGNTRTLSVGTLSATDCDFRDIAITGAAAGSSPTRAGDCKGNSGITFPAAKTVYWNLAGTQSWSDTAWAPGSGGTPDINNFPLAQDTAVFDNTGAAGTVTIQTQWNIGTFDASLRTSAMTFGFGGGAVIHGDIKLGTGITTSAQGSGPFMAGRVTQTITSNGITFNNPIIIHTLQGTTQLADALSLGATRTLTLTSGTFDAVTYNVTVGLFTNISSFSNTLKMGSGTWTISGTGTVWDVSTSGNTFYKNTANIVLSDTSTSARTFSGNGISYNKLTIGGTTGISTTTITGDNQFTELASTKTVAHTIALGTTTQTFGKWTVTGTAGNVVTLTGTGTSHILAGACTSGIDYLAMGSIGFAATSPGEFYAGANSTGTAGAPVYRTAKPADSTRYWVGGTGNWSATTSWSTTSGGASGAAVPRSHDDVIFNSASNAIAYTATVDAVTGGIRMKSLTIAGPLVGNVTLAGSAAMVGIHGNVTLPATGLTRTYTGAITLSSNSTGLTFTTNGVALASAITVNGVDCGWSMLDALNAGSSFITLANGSFTSNGYNITAAGFGISENTVTLTLGASVCTFSNANPFYHTSGGKSLNFTFNVGTSAITFSSSTITQIWNSDIIFYNVIFSNTSISTTILSNANETYNNLTIAAPSAAGLRQLVLRGNVVVTGTLTFSAGTNATMRHFCRSDTIGTTRTITAAAVSMTDVDFRDITIAGAAAPASGTRIGDCKGNSGITFTAAANKYWNLAAGGNWGGAIGWATSSGGTPAINNFPLAQDTCVFEATGLNSGATVTVNQSYNIGTIDMSARTANTMTLTTSVDFSIYGNWINGTGTTLSNTVNVTFAGRNVQNITSAGVLFAQRLIIDSIAGTVSLQDSLTTNSGGGNPAITITNGTFDATSYNVTLSGATVQGGISSSNSNTRTIAIGSGTWTLTNSGGWSTGTSTNLTVTGTGTISLTSASAKTFAGGGVAYTNITLNQGGAGTLTISGNNTLKDITNTYKATGATTINMGTTTQRVSQWTAAGEAGRLLTIQGTSSSSPCTLVHTGTGTAANVDYLVITGVRAY